MANQKEKYMKKRFEKECLVNRNLAKPGKHELILVLDHLKGGFNIGKIFRSAEVFSIKEIHVVGTKFFDPIPAKGALKKVPALFFDEFSSSYERLMELGYEVFAFESSESTYLHETEFPLKSAFILGHEEMGVSYEKEDYSSIRSTKIRQWGPVESLNVSIAASIAMYEYTRQMP